MWRKAQTVNSTSDQMLRQAGVAYSAWPAAEMPGLAFGFRCTGISGTPAVQSSALTDSGRLR